MKAVRPAVASNGFLYLHDVGSIALHVREGGGKKKGEDGDNFSRLRLIIHGAMDSDLKNLKLGWWCLQLLYGFLANGHFLSDSHMIVESVHRSPGIYLTAEEIPGKPQLGDHLTKVVRPVIPQMGSLTSR